MKLKIVDPIRSMMARVQAKYHPPSSHFRAFRPDTFGNMGGSILPGEVLNPQGKGGFGDSPPAYVLVARYKSGFKPGQVPNPYGSKGYKGAGIKRPRKMKTKRVKEIMKRTIEHREIQEIARMYAKDAIEALGEMLTSETVADTAKIAAANTVFDRAFGKPMQTNLNASLNPDGKPNEIDGRELDKRIAETIQRVDSITKRTREKIVSPERPVDLRKLN